MVGESKGLRVRFTALTVCEEWSSERSTCRQCHTEAEVLKVSKLEDHRVLLGIDIIRFRVWYQWHIPRGLKNMLTRQ